MTNRLDEIKNSEIILYGFGVYGVKAFYLLRRYGMHPECFADRDEAKHGYAMGKLQCIGYDAVMECDRKKTVIIVCNKAPQSIMEHFMKSGFIFVFSLDELRMILRDEEKLPGQLYNNEEQVRNLKQAIEKIYLGEEPDNMNEGFNGLFLSDLEYRCRQA